MLLQITCGVLFPPLIWIVWTYIKHLYDCLSYPQGPIPLPFIGNAHLLRKGEPCKELVNLGKIYGDVFGFSIGSIRYVVVNSLEGIKEVLIKKGSQFAGRPRLKLTISKGLNRAMNGLIISDPSPRFKILRKLASSSLKIYAEGLDGMEKKAINEYSYLNKKLSTMNGKTVSLKRMIEFSTLNIICTILFNHRYDENDQEFQDIIKYSNLSVKVSSATSLISSIPWLHFFPSAASRNIYEIIRLRDPILKRKLQEHRNSYDENNLRDVTDSLIKVSLNSALENDSHEKITDDNIEFLLNDFIIAGSETSSNTVLWFIVYMLHWPEYQNKLYYEILKITSGNRYPCLSDRPMLHLMQAAIHETLRLSSVAPLGVAHKAMESSSICGKPVPRGAFILTNLWSIHHDENHWNNAMSFYPERWLEKSGEFSLKLGEAYLPFSSGPRSCLGETLAKIELFVFISRLVKDYRFEKPAEEDLPNLNGESGITRNPFEFKVMVIPRN
ncbi:steroid 17-alpha-hydroxylase/17,20 lyase isoform X4 [Hydra vulgaris]|uniref:Steroid 17-alpha-hydroxylase/17,20 lyase isoform X4 n=1 Tax=Hydra vulgaris TaxID=6087 RepID=A0ABM4BTU6_HYDVU